MHSAIIANRPSQQVYYYVGLEHIEKNTGRILPEAKEEVITTVKNKFVSGEILYGKLRPNLNKVAMAHRDGVCSTDILVLRPSTRLNARYLYHFMLSSKFVKDMSANVSGANLPRVSTRFLLEYTIPLPPFDEQTRIANMLDKADALRHKDHELLQKYNKLAQSIFYEMFGDPVENEKKWSMTTLKELGSWRSGGTPARNVPAFFHGSIPWLSSGELDEMYVGASKEHITEEAVKSSAAKLVCPGSLLLGMYDTAALKSSITTQELTCNQAIAFARLDDERCSTPFVYYYIQLAKEHLKRGQRGVRQKNLNLSMVKELPVIFPPLSMQRTFGETLAHLNSQKSIVQEAAGKSAFLFESLLSAHYN